MVEWRKARSLDYYTIAKSLDISPGLLEMIENGDVTHPNIAKRIQELYKLTDEETEELIPENYRTSSKGYDPDKFKDPEDMEFNFKNRTTGDVYYYYLHEHNIKGYRT